MTQPRISDDRVSELIYEIEVAAAGAAMSETPGADARIARYAEYLAVLNDLSDARKQLDCERSVLAMTVARLGGNVEGKPTARRNFLQRIDALVKMEQSATPPSAESPES